MKAMSTPVERIMTRVVETPGPLDTDCWICTYSANSSAGHTQIAVNGQMRGCHVVMYESVNGNVPAGLHLDHLCSTPPCVNPAHLEAVTPFENFLRGTAPNAITIRTNVCKRGHSMDDAYEFTNGRRRCRPCAKANAALHAAARRHAVIGQSTQP